MKGFSLLAGLVLFCTHAANAQKFKYKNSFQFEVGGHGLCYSLNYERVVLNTPRFKLASQLGVAYYPPAIDFIPLWIPITVNGIYKIRGHHHLELGGGYLVTNYVFPNENGFFAGKVFEWQEGAVIGRLGYRFQKPESKWLFRAAFTPFYLIGPFPEFVPSAGVAVGRTF